MAKAKLATSKVINEQLTKTEFLAVGYNTREKYWAMGMRKPTKAKAFDSLFTDYDSQLSNCFILEVPKQDKAYKDLSHVRVIKVELL